jgi:hypothetical protein
MIKNFEERSDFLIYIERSPDQKMSNLANIIIEDKSAPNTIVTQFRDAVFNPHYECKLKSPEIWIQSPTYGGCEGCNILCSNAKEKKPVVIQDRTNEYINKYIITEFDENYNVDETLLELRGGLLIAPTEDVINWDLVAEKIRSITYGDFLKTYYWNIISRYLKKEAKEKCRVCNSGGILHVHHRTYDIHGYEANNLKDLIVLCEKCHALFHGKSKNK